MATHFTGPATELVEQFEADARMYRESAERALRDLINDAQEALRNLAVERVRATVGGAVLNAQRWQDSERALVRYWDAASTAAILKRELEQEQ